MALIVKQKNGSSINQWQPGDRGNPNGRPKKFHSELSAIGYKQSELNDCILVMLALTVDELKMILDNNCTVLEKTIAAALLKGINKGSLYALDTLLSRVYGKPKESVAISAQDEKKITGIQVNYVFPKEWTQEQNDRLLELEERLKKES